MYCVAESLVKNIKAAAVIFVDSGECSKAREYDFQALATKEMEGLTATVAAAVVEVAAVVLAREALSRRVHL